MGIGNEVMKRVQKYDNEETLTIMEGTGIISDCLRSDDWDECTICEGIQLLHQDSGDVLLYSLKLLGLDRWYNLALEGLETTGIDSKGVDSRVCKFIQESE